MMKDKEMIYEIKMLYAVLDEIISEKERLTKKEKEHTIDDRELIRLSVYEHLARIYDKEL